jgi:hypothetical protein
MNKKTKLKLNETLDKALEPPKRKDKNVLDEMLSQYVVEEAPKLEIVPQKVETQPPTVLPTYAPTNLPTHNKAQSIAPEKDFARVPNSIKRAVEAGHFPNSSLAIYLYLYSLTRGAIKPKRSIRVNKTTLLNGSNLRAEKALLKNLAHLKNIGLLKITVFNGDHAGNEYEVFVPEEIEGNQPTYLPTKQPTYLITEDTPVPTNQTLVGRTVQTIENKRNSDPLRLSLKTNTKTDDESAVLNEVLRQIGKGKPASWRELAEVLKAEFEAASSRTDSVSDAPAFLAEHLRRRLAAKPQRTEKAKPFEPGKDELIIEAEVFTPEPLTEEGREVVLNNLRRMPREEANGYQDHYTTEDWEWLVEKLG